jgi:hypothetical protein
MRPSTHAIKIRKYSGIAFQLASQLALPGVESPGVESLVIESPAIESTVAIARVKTVQNRARERAFEIVKI